MDRPHSGQLVMQEGHTESSQASQFCRHPRQVVSSQHRQYEAHSSQKSCSHVLHQLMLSGLVTYPQS